MGTDARHRSARHTLGRLARARMDNDAFRWEAGPRPLKTIGHAITEAGMFRLLTPTRFGGYAVDLRTVIDVAETRYGCNSCYDKTLHPGRTT